MGLPAAGQDPISLEFGESTDGVRVYIGILPPLDSDDQDRVEAVLSTIEGNFDCHVREPDSGPAYTEIGRDTRYDGRVDIRQVGKQIAGVLRTRIGDRIDYSSVRVPTEVTPLDRGQFLFGGIATL